MSSDSSEDENAARMLEAVDKTFFNDDMFKKKPKSEIAKAEKPKSQRYLECEDVSRDVRVSADMQLQIGKRVSDIIQSKIKFVSPPEQETKEVTSIEGGIKLFSDSTNFVTDDAPEEVLLPKERRKKIKKRKLDIDDEVTDCSVSDVVVSGELVMEGKDTKNWSSRRKAKVFGYKVTGKHASKLVLESVDSS